MNDFVFTDSFYWLIMNHDFIKMYSAIMSFVALVITSILIIRKWGDSY